MIPAVKPKGTTFLLVEDDNAHAKIVMRTFAREQVSNKIERVKDGVEALRYLRHEGEYGQKPHPDVVLLDLKLPKMSGLEVLEVIRGDEKLHALPVVVLSSSEADVDKARAYRLHANSYLVKPTDATSFRQMVKDLNGYWGAWNQDASTAREEKKGEML